jgi:multiple sugar transport system substrate-binding protein
VTGWYSFPGPNSIKITEVIREHLRRVVTLQISPEEALALMQRDIEALLSKS